MTKPTDWVALKMHYDLRVGYNNNDRIILANRPPSFSVEELESFLPFGTQSVNPPIGDLLIWTNLALKTLLIYEKGELRLITYRTQYEILKDLDRMAIDVERGVQP